MHFLHQLLKIPVCTFCQICFKYDWLNHSEFSIQAHKAVLSSASPTLGDMLQKLPHNGILDLALSGHGIQAMLKFCYTGQIVLHNVEMANELLMISTQFRIAELQQECQRYIESERKQTPSELLKDQIPEIPLVNGINEKNMAPETEWVNVKIEKDMELESELARVEIGQYSDQGMELKNMKTEKDLIHTVPGIQLFNVKTEINPVCETGFINVAFNTATKAELVNSDIHSTRDVECHNVKTEMSSFCETGLVNVKTEVVDSAQETEFVNVKTETYPATETKFCNVKSEIDSSTGTESITLKTEIHKEESCRCTSVTDE